ncbi:MAG: MmgE/PrpD family protein, partial [Nocardioidaceae bacterium]
ALRGRVDPTAFSPAARRDPRLLDLARRVDVRHDAELDARLPGERANRVTLFLADGRTLTVEVPNPVGDADHLPMGPADVRAKLVALVGERSTQTVADVAADLAGASDARVVLARLP